ncbi:hypothetical protein [Mycolicibacterium sp. S2-37]|uniref:hypothetical protein n=1 Tax=Mycolicibacterium sp. S2-37 TaxID=2810297 RepID=UPI001F5FDE8D|nr:hypothetical protein [Mycolicibacterium sp. S2-37]
MFDLLTTSSLLREHVAAGKVSLAINRTMNNWQSGSKKDLDLVIARTAGGGESPSVSLEALAEKHAIQLTDDDRQVLDGLPVSPAGTAGATVLVALEAKAAMTAHGKARSRLYDELNSSHLTVHGDNNNALAVGFVTINFAGRIVSPTNQASGEPTYNPHKQPRDTERVIERMKEINRRPGPQAAQSGFDALGIMVVELENDGSPVRIVTEPPAPQPNSDFYYDRMIVRTAHLYDSSFSHV